MNRPDLHVAIVDYGLGNLFSVQRACAAVGLEAALVSSSEEVERADGVVLPGVGAFGDAMEALRRRDLVGVLQETARSTKPFLGVCLGMQLLMGESFEFGRHRGLGVVEGAVVRLNNAQEPSDVAEKEGRGLRRVKVPQVGWNRIVQASERRDPWIGTLLEGVPEQEFMYFVHSFYARPEDPTVVLSTTRYGPVDFCSSLGRGNLFACQFHPEVSGPWGLRVYENFARLIHRVKEGWGV